jgi:hypothetical protein
MTTYVERRNGELCRAMVQVSIPRLIPESQQYAAGSDCEDVSYELCVEGMVRWDRDDGYEVILHTATDRDGEDWDGMLPDSEQAKCEFALLAVFNERVIGCNWVDA